MNKKLTQDNNKISNNKLNKNQIVNGYVKKSSFIGQSDGTLRRRRIKNKYEDILLEKNNYINIIKNLNEKEFKNINISQKSDKKEKEWYKSSSSTLNKLIDNLNENKNNLRKKKLEKSNSMINLKHQNRNKRNTMYLIDKNGDFCIEFIYNKSNNKKNFSNQNNYIIDENTSLVELEQIKQRLESNILEKKQQLHKKEKEKFINRKKQFPNEEFQLNLKGEKDKKNKNNFEESQKYNKSIIYKSNNFDNFFNLKHKKIFRKNHSLSNLYKNNFVRFFRNNNSDINLNSKKDKKNLSNSNIDLISNKSYIEKIKHLINFTSLNTIDKFYSSNSTNRKNYLLKNKSLESKKKRNVNNSYITDKYCDKMVGMNILSLSSSKYIKSLNEKNIVPNQTNFYYNKILNDLGNHEKKK